MKLLSGCLSPLSGITPITLREQPPRCFTARLRVLTSDKVEGSRPWGASSTSMSKPSEFSRGTPACRPGASRGRGSEGCSGMSGVDGQYVGVDDSRCGGDEDDDGGR